MAKLLTIELNQLHFLAYHGLYPEEQKTGNEFEVNLSIAYTPVGSITDISETVNYVSLYELLKTEMQKPRHLLETFVMETAEIIHTSFSQVKKIDITITKMQPPIAKFAGKVGVRYSREF